MSRPLVVILATLLLLCAVVTVILYRRSPQTWYWYASAVMGVVIAALLYDGLLGFSGISQPLSLILSLVLAGLLLAVAALLYRRSGVSTKAWYGYLAVVGALLLFLGLLEFFAPGSTWSGLALFVGSLSIISVLWRRTRTR
jgi:asparagine N-glycosylation enzyme membrane subunit Stt3